MEWHQQGKGVCGGETVGVQKRAASPSTSSITPHGCQTRVPSKKKRTGKAIMVSDTCLAESVT